MTISPSFNEFKALARKGNLIPLSVTLVADALTPVSLLASAWKKSEYCFLLESVEGGEKIGRYSVLSFNPRRIFTEKNGVTMLTSPSSKGIATISAPVLDVLKEAMAEIKPVSVPGLPRFFGGMVGFCSYETVHSIEKLPRTKPDTLGWPTATFIEADDLFVFDNVQQLLKIIVCVRTGKGSPSLKVAYAQGLKRLRQHVEFLKDVRVHFPKKGKATSRGKLKFESNISRDVFMRSVRKAKEYIGSGDIIQVVLSRRSSAKTSASPLDIYRALRVVNPSPYMYIFKSGTKAVIGSSPEALVRLEDGVVSTRPIAGTRRRGATETLDRDLAQGLLKDPKELAEHIMLVDLGRNDIGRVCEPGSVTVPTFKKIEKYSHVMHIVSEVTGTLKKGKDAFDLLRAVFPAGTVSGAPKIRAMEIIDELEESERGPYAGSLGYISYSGNMDMAITIRTILWDEGRVSIQTGAGLVADSNPAREYDETENKAAGLKATLELAESGRLFWERL